MSMASYNLLKAAADGLADAINYRTNLKRRRREEEYNYNRDLQRNENEYQRDLGRKRDEQDYTTEYNWKQQQRAHDRDIEWANQKREANKARILGFADTYNPANVNRHDWTDVQNFNLNALANDVPLSIKYEDLESLDKDMKNKLALLEKEHQYKMAQIDAQNKYRTMGRGGSGQTQFERNANYILGLKPEQREILEASGYIRGGSPKAVKGGSGKGAVMEQGGIPHLDKELQYYQNKIDNYDKEITNYENQNQINLNDYYQKVNSIINDNSLNQKQKEERLKDLEKETLANIAQTKSILKNLYADRDAAQANLDYATRYKYNNEYSASGTQYIHIPTQSRKETEAAGAESQSDIDEANMLLGLTNRNTASPTSQIPPSVINSSKYSIPPLISSGIGSPTVVLPELPRASYMPQNSYQYK